MANQKVRVSVTPDHTFLTVANGAEREYTASTLPAALAALHPADVAPLRALARSILEHTPDVTDADTIDVTPASNFATRALAAIVRK